MIAIRFSDQRTPVHSASFLRTVGMKVCSRTVYIDLVLPVPSEVLISQSMPKVQIHFYFPHGCREVMFECTAYKDVVLIGKKCCLPCAGLCWNKHLLVDFSLQPWPQSALSGWKAKPQRPYWWHLVHCTTDHLTAWASNRPCIICDFFSATDGLLR